ncbi:uncharacterized protein FIBRA_01887 [Fibroporia radiculosa]|uniref:Ribosomal protein S6 n=1 Tax=Fibroporia radiculosa TaxID=599839 RepID=J4HU16_9APHY|nr:uncharacterized protein FIBRA_01887 [Fibroporia radiculosa]CCL99862.1 predicted protein [Fibroporia radiculosa]
MPFYQMLCIAAHYPEYQHLKQLVHQASSHVLTNGGVVRRFYNMGTLSLPQRMRRHKQYHQIGDYWMMYFDASPRTLHDLNAIMRRDPRVVRWTMLKLGDRVEDMVKPPAQTVYRYSLPLRKTSASLQTPIS